MPWPWLLSSPESLRTCSSASCSTSNTCRVPASASRCRTSCDRTSHTDYLQGFSLQTSPGPDATGCQGHGKALSTGAGSAHSCLPCSGSSRPASWPRADRPAGGDWSDLVSHTYHLQGWNWQASPGPDALAARAMTGSVNRCRSGAAACRAANSHDQRAALVPRGRQGAICAIL